MFETVVPEKFAKRSRKALYEALPLSIAFHALIVGAVVIADVWEVVFPEQSPSQAATFSLAEIPPPPPPPPPPPKPPADPLPARQITQIPKELLAPAIIPEEIPMVTPTAVIAELADASLDGIEGGVPGGEFGGVIGGVRGGDIGGTIGGTLGGIVTDPADRVTVERDRPLPMYPLSQVYPAYPEEARLRAWEDRLIVRYVIGKDGRVKEVSVISPPERPIFIEGTVRAIRNWRFRPLIKDGERQEVVHELTVFYRLHYEG